MTTTTLQTEHPATDAPTDTEWANHARWAVGPIGTRRELWIEREACAVHQERTHRADPWPTAEDYAVAAERIPTDVTWFA